MTHEIELTAGTIEYLDTGGDGPPLVLLGGLLMDHALWGEVVAELPETLRTIVPTLPLGGHRRAMGAGFDPSLRGIASLVEELLERLDLRDATLAGNDTGGAIVQLLAARRSPRVARIALIACDAFDNFPPGLTGRTLVASGKLPPVLFGAFMQQLRLKPVRRLPLAFGWLTKRGDATTKRWIRVAHKRDTVRVLRAMAADRGLMEKTAAELGRFDRPALIAWSPDDRVMPPEHARRLAALLPRARHVEIADSYTLIPLDQPARLAHTLADFALRHDHEHGEDGEDRGGDPAHGVDENDGAPGPSLGHIAANAGRAANLRGRGT